MKRITTLLLIILLANAVQAQSSTWLWAKAIGGTGHDRGFSIAIDPASGAVYTTGQFIHTVDFDPGAGVFNLTGGGLIGEGGFISKLDSSGNFIWAISLGGVGNSIAIDTVGSGDVYTTGYFNGTADFDPGVGVFNLTSAGNTDIFISKIDSSGNFVWAKAMGGTSNDRGSSIAIDPAGSGDVYTTGFFHGTVDFDPGAGTFNLTSAGVQDIFISKLDSSGNFVWAKRMGGTGDDNGRSIAIDPAGSGDVYTTGDFEGTADFDPDSSGSFDLTSAGGTDIFISKLAGSGNFVWAKRIGATSSNWFSDGGASIAIDPAGSGDVYTTGDFEGTVDFDPGAGVFNLTSAGNWDIFISKLDSSGNFVWAKAMGGTLVDVGYSIALEPAGSGDVYTTGYFNGTADFDPGVGVFNLTSAGNTDIFISKIDSSGNFVWAKAAGGADYDGGNSIALDASGHVSITGYFRSDFITFGSTTLPNANSPVSTSDIFIAKLDAVLITGNNEIESFVKGVLLYPNPAANHFTIALGSNNNKVEVTITDITGQLIYTTTSKETQKIEVNTKDFAGGIYVVLIHATDFIETKKLIVVK